MEQLFFYGLDFRSFLLGQISVLLILTGLRLWYIFKGLDK